MNLKQSTKREDWRPGLAVLMIDLPEAIYDPHIAPAAERFYSEVVELLRSRGFEVELYQRSATSERDHRAGLWVTHGASRISAGTVTPYNTDIVDLQTKARGLTFTNSLERARSAVNYMLSDAGRRELLRLRLPTENDWEDVKYRVKTPEVMIRAKRPRREVAEPAT